MPGYVSSLDQGRPSILWWENPTCQTNKQCRCESVSLMETSLLTRVECTTKRAAEKESENEQKNTDINKNKKQNPSSFSFCPSHIAGSLKSFRHTNAQMSSGVSECCFDSLANAISCNCWHCGLIFSIRMRERIAKAQNSVPPEGSVSPEAFACSFAIVSWANLSFVSKREWEYISQIKEARLMGTLSSDCALSRKLN